MQKRHWDRDAYFHEQAATTAKYVIPYIQEVKDIHCGAAVLEVGCGEGGNLLPFCKMGCRCVGVDVSESKINLGKKKLEGENAVLICSDIYDIQPDALPAFDLIFLRDVIEHIPNQERFIGFIKHFLKKDGVMFFAFPPWRMPFGGHQQVARSRLLSCLPFYHILPNPLYRCILKMGGESAGGIAALLGIKQTGISIGRFNSILRMHGFITLKKTDWLINPNYEVKFGLTPKKLRLLSRIPCVRDFFTTCYYCVVTKV